MSSDIMALEELLNGHELISRQTNSVKELPSQGLKKYCPDNSWLEKKQIENQLEERFNFIKGERIEKSNCLSQAEWIPDLKKAKVTKKVGKLWETLGHHQDNEDWLLPEEALFLIENCELQLFYNSICISIEDCYALIFQEGDCSIDEYRVFSYLSRAGLKIVRHSSSVSATRYERQVKLDSVIQMQRRSPLRPSPEENVTIIDDDISIVEDSSKKEDNSVINTASNATKISNEELVVIEIDDEPEVKEPEDEEIRDLDSDSDSDIVCISSPSYVPDKIDTRHWYPPIRKCLRVPIEPVIDLSDESDPSEDKRLVQSKIDLLRASKSEILSYVPSAKNGVSFIHAPDSRLLPPNVVPRYSEYKVNLNIKGDDTNRTWVNRDRNYTNGNTNFSNTEMGFQMENNPLLMKAQEMQVMAMSMIQTAATLMSAIQSVNQNPNELWNMNFGNIHQNLNNPGNTYRNGGNGMVPFNPRSAIMNYARPRLWYPRRNPRRRMLYNRRYPWTPRKPQWFDNNRPNFDNSQNSPSPAVAEVVILSDDDVEIKSIGSESGSDSTNKRKRNIEGELNKRLKTETDPDNDSLIGSESSCIIVDAFNNDTNVKKESKENIIKMESELKIKSECKSIAKTESNEIRKENGDLQKPQADASQNKITNIVKSEVESLNKPSEKEENLSQDNIAVVTGSINTVEKDESLSMEVIENSQTEKMEEKQLPSTSDISAETSQEPLMDVAENVGSNKTSQPEISPRKEDCVVLNDSASSIECVDTQNETCEEITSWEQYKTRSDDFDESDSLVKFKECSTYGHVLSALQIFKRIEVNRINRKFKISFDVYLPDSNFKKSLKVLPNYRVIVLKTNEELPTYTEIEGLNIEYQDNIPFLFSIVFDESIAFYLYNNVSLNTLFD